MGLRLHTRVGLRLHTRLGQCQASAMGLGQLGLGVFPGDSDPAPQVCSLFSEQFTSYGLSALTPGTHSSVRSELFYSQHQVLSVVS